MTKVVENFMMGTKTDDWNYWAQELAACNEMEDFSHDGYGSGKFNFFMELEGNFEMMEDKSSDKEEMDES